MTANICGQGEHKMARSTDWTRSETLAAFHIYLQLPFGQHAIQIRRFQQHKQHHKWLADASSITI
jgi:hypothetical protein